MTMNNFYYKYHIETKGVDITNDYVFSRKMKNKTKENKQSRWILETYKEKKHLVGIVQDTVQDITAEKTFWSTFKNKIQYSSMTKMSKSQLHYHGTLRWVINKNLKNKIKWDFF